MQTNLINKFGKRTMINQTFEEKIHTPGSEYAPEQSAKCTSGSGYSKAYTCFVLPVFNFLPGENSACSHCIFCFNQKKKKERKKHYETNHFKDMPC